MVIQYTMQSYLENVAENGNERVSIASKFGEETEAVESEGIL